MVSNANILRDVLFFIKNDLLTNITDPIVSTRPSSTKFVMTSYPQRETVYPLITIKDTGIKATEKLGMQSESFIVRLPFEVRIWARNTKERDTLFDAVFDRLRTNQLPESSSGTSSYADIHDFKVDNVLNIDETGENGVKSKIINVSYMFVVN